jgi:hypothetical protein
VVVLAVRVVLIVLVEELLAGLPPETAALKNDHVSPGANLTPLVPDGSGTWPPPCAIQVTAVREQLYVVLMLACYPAEGSGAFCKAQPSVCSHLSRSWRPSEIGSTSSAAPWIPRYATGVVPQEQPESWAPEMTATALKTLVCKHVLVSVGLFFAG